MYRNVILTLLLIAAIVIAFELRPRHATIQVEPSISTTARQILDRKVPSLVILMSDGYWMCGQFFPFLFPGVRYTFRWPLTGDGEG